MAEKHTITRWMHQLTSRDETGKSVSGYGGKSLSMMISAVADPGVVRLKPSPPHLVT